MFGWMRASKLRLPDSTEAHTRSLCAIASLISGDLTPEINDAIAQSDLVCASVLSGNRNFEARIHPNIKANFLASPPLVVAYALAGTVLKNLMTEPVGQNDKGQDVW